MVLLIGLTVGWVIGGKVLIGIMPIGGCEAGIPIIGDWLNIFPIGAWLKPIGCELYDWLTMFWMNGFGPDNIKRSSLAELDPFVTGADATPPPNSSPNKSFWAEAGADAFWLVPFDAPNGLSLVGLVAEVCFFKWLFLRKKKYQK